MIGTAFAVGRVANARFQDIGLHFDGAREGGVEVIDLEPEKDAVAVRFFVWIPDGAVVMVDGPAVELEDEFAVPDKAFVFAAAVVAFEAEEALVPATGGFDVGCANEGLRMRKPSTCSRRLILLRFCSRQRRGPVRARAE